MIDLHSHSTASDGMLTPTELAKHAKEIGLEAIALTDHDTSEGINEFMKAGQEIGLETIPGMETTINYDDCDIHIVSLYTDNSDPEMRLLLDDLFKSRQERNEELLLKLQKAGLPIYKEDLAVYGDRAISRGHYARILADRGYGATPQEVTKKYMSKGTVGYVKRRTPDPEWFLEKIHNAGGLAFVAHIHQIDAKSEEHCIELTKKMLDYGADGIETLYCEYNDHLREVAESIIKERKGLLRSGGSDFHGEAIKPGLELGTGYGDLNIPYSYLAAIKERLGRK